MKDQLQEIDKQGVCHTAALPFTLESKYLKAKEELWKLKYFTMQKYNLLNNPLKETKVLQDIITL
jgi:hypothetical protein